MSGVIPRSVHDREELAALLRRDPGLHAYELGDLDDFFWPYTSWFRHGDAVALLYHGLAVPTLIALAEGFDAEPYGRHLKMALTDTDRLAAAEPAGEVMDADDLPDLLRLYA